MFSVNLFRALPPTNNPSVSWDNILKLHPSDGFHPGCWVWPGRGRANVGGSLASLAVGLRILPQVLLLQLHCCHCHCPAGVLSPQISSPILPKNTSTRDLSWRYWNCYFSSCWFLPQVITSGSNWFFGQNLIHSLPASRPLWLWRPTREGLPQNDASQNLWQVFYFTFEISIVLNSDQVQFQASS